MSRPGASDRVRRLLSVVPWIAANNGAPVDEVCARFGLDRDALLADLDVIFMVGLYPYTPDELVEVVIEDERVWIHYADFFSRPLRLTPEQALALVAASSSLLAIPGADPGGPLARGLAKLASALGIEPAATVAVDLGDAEQDTLALLRAAASQRRRVRLRYYSYGRDEVTERTIDPHHVYADGGQWYVAAHCHVAAGDRIFRVDRISDPELLDEIFEAPNDEVELASYHPSADDPRIVLELAPQDRWVLSQYPNEGFEITDDGRIQVTLAVSARPWLERLLLRVGASATVIEADDPLDPEIGRDAARRLLARYRS